MSYDLDPRDAHDRAIRKLRDLGDSLERRRKWLERAPGAARLGARPGAGDMGEGDEPPPRRYPAEDADREERAAGRRLRHAYWGILGERPTLGPGDRDGAITFLARITTAIEQGGWTRNEWTTLYELERKWRARAEGRDPRFEVAGTAPGRLRKGQEQQIRIARDRVRQIARTTR